MSVTGITGSFLIDLLKSLGLNLSKEQESAINGLFQSNDDPNAGEDQVDLSPTAEESFKSTAGDDGKLELAELQQRATAYLSKYATEDEKKKYGPMMGIFLDDNNKVDENFFKQVAGDKGYVTADDIKKMDKDGDGRITKEEVAAFKGGQTNGTPNTPPPSTPGGALPAEPEPDPIPVPPPAKEDPTLESAFQKAAGDDDKLTQKELQSRVEQYLSGGMTAAEKAEFEPIMQLFLKDGKVDMALFNKLADKDGNVKLDKILALDANKNGEITEAEIEEFKNPTATQKDKDNLINDKTVKDLNDKAMQFLTDYNKASAAIKDDPKIKAAYNSIQSFIANYAKIGNMTKQADLNALKLTLTNSAGSVSGAVSELNKAIQAEQSKNNTKPTGKFDDDFMNDMEVDLDSKFTSTTSVYSGHNSRGDKDSNGIREGQRRAYTTTVNNAINQVQQMNDKVVKEALKSQFNYDSLSAEEKKVVDQKIEMITKAALFKTIAEMMSSEDSGNFKESGIKAKWEYSFKPKDLTEKYLENIQKIAKQSDDPKRLYKSYSDAVENFKPYIKFLTNNKNETTLTKDLVKEAREGASGNATRFPSFFSQNDEVNPMNKQYNDWANNNEYTLQNYDKMVEDIQRNLNNSSSNIPDRGKVSSDMHNFQTKMYQARELIRQVNSAGTTAEKKDAYEKLTTLMQEINQLSWQLEQYRYNNNQNQYQY